MLLLLLYPGVRINSFGVCCFISGITKNLYNPEVKIIRYKILMSDNKKKDFKMP